MNGAERGRLCHAAAAAAAAAAPAPALSYEYPQLRRGTLERNIRAEAQQDGRVNLSTRRLIFVLALFVHGALVLLRSGLRRDPRLHELRRVDEAQRAVLLRRGQRQRSSRSAQGVRGGAGRGGGAHQAVLLAARQPRAGLACRQQPPRVGARRAACREQREGAAQGGSSAPLTQSLKQCCVTPEMRLRICVSCCCCIANCCGAPSGGVSAARGQRKAEGGSRRVTCRSLIFSCCAGSICCRPSIAGAGPRAPPLSAAGAQGGGYSRKDVSAAAAASTPRQLPRLTHTNHHQLPIVARIARERCRERGR